MSGSWISSSVKNEYFGMVIDVFPLKVFILFSGKSEKGLYANREDDKAGTKRQLGICRRMPDDV